MPDFRHLLSLLPRHKFLDAYASAGEAIADAFTKLDDRLRNRCDMKDKKVARHVVSSTLLTSFEFLCDKNPTWPFTFQVLRQRVHELDTASTDQIQDKWDTIPGALLSVKVYCDYGFDPGSARPLSSIEDLFDDSIWSGPMDRFAAAPSLSAISVPDIALDNGPDSRQQERADRVRAQLRWTMNVFPRRFQLTDHESDNILQVPI